MLCYDICPKKKAKLINASGIKYDTSNIILLIQN